MISPVTDINFFTGGNAIFTITNGKGKHYTYRIKKSPHSKPLFIRYLTGMGEGGREYTYLGVLDRERLSPVITKASKLNYGSEPVKVLRWAISKLKNNKPLPEGYQIMHVGRCCACARKLTNPKSIKIGIGPTCLQEREESYAKESLFNL